MPEDKNLGDSAVDEVLSRANKVIAKLENGAGKVEGCQAHAPMAEGIVCISKMVMPLYKKAVVDDIHSVGIPLIRSKWFTASGYGAMFPVVVIFAVLSICYTVIRVAETTSKSEKEITNVSSLQR